MKRAALLLLLVMILGQASQAQPGHREKRSVGEFDKVTFAVPGEVIINIGKSYSIELEGDESFISELKTTVSGGRLEIKDSRKWQRSLGIRRVIVRITMPALTGVNIAGSGAITVNDMISGSQLDAGISGSGTLRFHGLAYEYINCSIIGSGSVRTEGNGTIGNLEMVISGSGSYKGPDTIVETLEARITGSGHCNCHVTGMLKARITGSGNIIYYGNPKTDATITGSGKVKMR